MFSAVTEAYDVGARAGLAELGALSDADARRIAGSTPNTRAVDRLAAETVELVTETHRGILRGVEDGYRQVISEVSETRSSVSTPVGRPRSAPSNGSPTGDCGRSSTRAGARGR
ncbi:hypothetical protein [Streptomyces xanthophaeus]|uniref:hypothetical protein n=1 Tax=Streptomyces xanthophaeus TaxID=67385 RepID=UPI002649173D|nr:hypothetical protein [Streptomyces xanthophaeus]